MRASHRLSLTSVFLPGICLTCAAHGTVRLNAGVLQRLERSLPVGPGTFRRRGGDAMRPQPVGHCPQPVRQRAELLRDGVCMPLPASYRRTASVMPIETDGPGARLRAGRRRAAIRRGPCGTSSDALLVRRNRGGALGAGKHPPSRRSSICCSFTACGRGSMLGATASVFATGKGLPPPRSKLRRLVPLPHLEDATTPPSPLNVAGRQLAFYDSRVERRTGHDGLWGARQHSIIVVGRRRASIAEGSKDSDR